MGSQKASIQQFVDDQISKNKVMIFSKTYCPYCKMAKDTFARELILDLSLFFLCFFMTLFLWCSIILTETNTSYGLVELDERNDGDQIQDYLLKKTGARSVPRVFIHGKCIGGGSETKELHKAGKLVPLIQGN